MATSKKTAKKVAKKTAKKAKPAATPAQLVARYKETLLSAANKKLGGKKATRVTLRKHPLKGQIDKFNAAIQMIPGMKGYEFHSFDITDGDFCTQPGYRYCAVDGDFACRPKDQCD